GDVERPYREHEHDVAHYADDYRRQAGHDVVKEPHRAGELVVLGVLGKVDSRKDAHRNSYERRQRDHEERALYRRRYPAVSLYYGALRLRQEFRSDGAHAVLDNLDKDAPKWDHRRRYAADRDYCEQFVYELA